jgi:L-ascorbate metabolism protein UlaG (beta-lactamase superfamily)
MNITHFGHACVLVEMDGIRTLIDPGAYATGFEDVVDLDLVLATHEHRDHVDRSGWRPCSSATLPPSWSRSRR